MTGLINRLAEVVLRSLLEITEDHRGDLGRSVFLVANVNLHDFIAAAGDFVRDDLFFLLNFVVTTPHEAFDAEHGVLGVGDLLVSSRLADQPVSLIGKTDHRRSCPIGRLS